MVDQGLDKSVTPRPRGNRKPGEPPTPSMPAQRRRVALADSEAMPPKAPERTQAEELDELYPSDDVITIGERMISGPREITIQPVTIRRIGKVANAIGRVHVNMQQPTEDILVELITWHTEDMIEAIVAATGLESAFVAALEFDDFAKLLLAVFKVNQSFFDRLPALAGGLEVVIASVGRGQRPSPISNETASPTPDR